LEVRGGEIFAGPTRGATNLLRFPDHDHVHHLLSEGRALASEACASRIRRLLQKSKRNRLHLSAMIDPDIDTTAVAERPDGRAAASDWDCCDLLGTVADQALVPLLAMVAE